MRTRAEILLDIKVVRPSRRGHKAEPPPLFQQIASQIRVAIDDGMLGPGARMPSQRALAEQLSVDRKVVVAAYDLLTTQGYLTAREGSGTRVADTLPRITMRATRSGRIRSLALPPPQLSSRAQHLAGLPSAATSRNGRPRPFRCGVPALDAFPDRLWADEIRKAWSNYGPRLLDYGSPLGYPPLREAIAEFRSASRALRCTADQVVIVHGSQQGLALCASLLADAGDEAWVEDPIRTTALSAFRAAGLRLIPIHVDADSGMDVEEGSRDAPNARLAYVSPSYSFPLGAEMSLPRRRLLLNWAETHNAWIVEDDYNAEFRYVGPPLASLQGMDRTDRVVYVGGFSRVLFPSLRIGHLVVPEGLVDTFARARSLVDGHNEVASQVALAQFIADGKLNRHLQQLRTLCQDRQHALLEAAEVYLEGLLDLQPADAGTHLVGWLPDGVDDRAAEVAAADHGVEVTALSRFTIAQPRPPALLLGYATAPIEQVEAAVHRLARALSTLV